MSRPKAAVLIILAMLCLANRSEAKTVSYTPSHVPPPELQANLGAHDSGGRTVVDWTIDGTGHAVEVRRNDPANLLLFSGDDAAVDAVLELARSYDKAPRQISLEARIVEVDTDRARDLGVDWNELVLSVDAQQSANRRHSTQELKSPYGGNRSQLQSSDGLVADNVRLTLSDALHMLESNGAARTHDVPRVITLNNRRATIFDGQRVTFTTRANGYASIYVADTMDAGLKLDVTPSLLESGQLRLKLTAELTDLVLSYDPYLRGTAYSSIGGSPIKRGQIVENTIVARDGQAIVLGGFTRTVDRRVQQRFPILGRVLPFLFSREIVQQSQHESLITMTPRIVDLEVGPNDAQKGMLEGR